MLHRLCEGSQIGLCVEVHDDYMNGLRGVVVQESRDTLTYGIGKASSSIRVQFDQESLAGMNDWQRKIWDEVGRGDPERADKRWVWSKDCTIVGHVITHSCGHTYTLKHDDTPENIQSYREMACLECFKRDDPDGYAAMQKSMAEYIEQNIQRLLAQ